MQFSYLIFVLNCVTGNDEITRRIACQQKKHAHVIFVMQFERR